MTRTETRVPTENAGRYIAQLCKHWSHKLQVESNDRSARIIMPSGAVTRLEAEADSLGISIEAADGDTLAVTKDVVASHLDRFAFREAPLPFEWRDSAA
jgi:hypothetical protein